MRASAGGKPICPDLTASAPRIAVTALMLNLIPATMRINPVLGVGCGQIRSMYRRWGRQRDTLAQIRPQPTNKSEELGANEGGRTTAMGETRVQRRKLTNQRSCLLITMASPSRVQSQMSCKRPATPESKKMRERATMCHRLAVGADDPTFAVKLNALAEEYEAKAVQAEQRAAASDKK